MLPEGLPLFTHFSSTIIAQLILKVSVCSFIVVQCNVCPSLVGPGWFLANSGGGLEGPEPRTKSLLICCAQVLFLHFKIWQMKLVPLDTHRPETFPQVLKGRMSAGTEVGYPVNPALSAAGTTVLFCFSNMAKRPNRKFIRKMLPCHKLRHVGFRWAAPHPADLSANLQIHAVNHVPIQFGKCCVLLSQNRHVRIECGVSDPVFPKPRICLPGDQVTGILARFASEHGNPFG